MSGKSDITFLLNPQSSNGGVIPPTSPPPPTFQRLVDVARSPNAPVMSSLILLGSCIAPLEKRSIASKKAPVPMLLLSAETEVISNSGDNDEAEHQQETTITKDGTPTTTKARVGRKRIRKNRSLPCQVENCKNNAVSRGCCDRHGGGSRCTVSGCSNRAKLYKLCFQTEASKRVQQKDARESRSDTVSAGLMAVVVSA